MSRPFNKIAVAVLDGVGCGVAKDTASKFPADVGANSLVNTSNRHPLNINTLCSMGLQCIPGLKSQLRTTTPLQAVDSIRGAFGCLEPTFAGNGSPEGHQALMGHIVTNPYLLFDKTGIPNEVSWLVEAAVTEVIGKVASIIRHPGTDNISGTDFIEGPAGKAHFGFRSTKQILVPVYSSTDSVLQIALHWDHVNQENIVKIGEAVRRRLDELKLRVGRVIMRPYAGLSGRFERIGSCRTDFGMDPDEPTLVDHLEAAGTSVHALGKTAEMLNGKGFYPELVQKLDSDSARFQALNDFIGDSSKSGLMFANFKNTDEKSGHRRNPELYAQYLAEADKRLGEITASMQSDALLIITSDHGNDPTHAVCSDDTTKPHTNHTRERVPLLVYSPSITSSIALGVRHSFADVAATIAENFGIQSQIQQGESFLSNIASP